MYQLSHILAQVRKTEKLRRTPFITIFKTF
jgi:hypothetical protein